MQLHATWHIMEVSSVENGHEENDYSNVDLRMASNIIYSLHKIISWPMCWYVYIKYLWWQLQEPISIRPLWSLVHHMMHWHMSLFTGMAEITTARMFVQSFIQTGVRPPHHVIAQTSRHCSCQILYYTLGGSETLILCFTLFYIIPNYDYI